MASRLKAKNDLDPFWTPPFATRALCEIVLPYRLDVLRRYRVWEPACGEGHMAEVLREYFRDVYASDIHDWGYGSTIPRDFLDASQEREADWIITNPPFGKKTLPFVLRALDVAREGVAMFLPLRWIEGVERYEKLFRDQPPTLFAPFVERVPLCRGRWNPEGGTATAYCWLVWLKDAQGRIEPPRPTFWIPPGQRRLLTRPDDRARFAAWSLPHQEAAE